MAKGIHLNPEQVVNGSFGELVGYDMNARTTETLFLGEVQQVSYKIAIARRDINRSGTRKTDFKMMAVQGEGSVRRYKVNSDFLRIVGNVFHDGEGTGIDPAFLLGVPIPNSTLKRYDPRNANNKHHNVGFKTSMIVTLDDPEAVGVEQVRLKGVKFWEINGGWQVNEVVEEEIPFTFASIEPIYALVQDRPGGGYADEYTVRYNAQRNL